MFLLLIIPFIINSAQSTLICDICLCRDVNDQDYMGKSVLCAYSNPTLFKIDNELPSMVYSLDLSFNNITTVQNSSLFKSKTMKELILSHNVISDLNFNALELPELTRLDLSFNELEFIDKDDFYKLKKLEYLNLASNRFSKALAFHRLSNLNTIVLDNNNIGPSLMDANLFDRDGFGLTQKIRSLSISGINLKKVPDNFFTDAYDLKELTISNNQLNEIFEIPFTLEYLDLSNNPINEIYSEDFSNLKALKVLKLNNLSIKEVPDSVFAPLHALIKLEIERNINLTKFSALAFGREVLEDTDYFLLEELSVSGSRISKLDEKLAQPFGQLLKLDLQGNPWKCDCNLVWIKQLQISPKDYEHLRCAKPRPLFNARIFDLKESSFICGVDHHLAGVALAGIGFCLILAMIAIWFFVFIPRFQSRGNMLSTNGGAYSVLPMSSNLPNVFGA